MCWKQSNLGHFLGTFHLFLQLQITHFVVAIKVYFIYFYLFALSNMKSETVGIGYSRIWFFFYTNLYVFKSFINIIFLNGFNGITSCIFCNNGGFYESCLVR